MKGEMWQTSELKAPVILPPTISAMKLATLQVPEGCFVKYLVWNKVFLILEATEIS